MVFAPKIHASHPTIFDSGFERPPKLNAKDVVDYEIRMLEHCCQRVLESQCAPNALELDQLALLEAFLLHFRILLEFFGKPSESFSDNIHFQKPETYGVYVPPEVLSAAKARAQSLEREWGKMLNKFLAHPTERRYTTQRSWPIERMRSQMRELVSLWRACWNEPL